MFKKNIVANITVSQYLGELEIQGQCQPHSEGLSLHETMSQKVNKHSKQIRPNKKVIQQQTNRKLKKYQ